MHAASPGWGSEVWRCLTQGLAFLFTSKGGLGLSFEHGWGCVIQRLGKRAVDAEGGGADGCPDGCVWSAPAFVRINNVGVGLTVGARSAAAWSLENALACAPRFSLKKTIYSHMKHGKLPPISRRHARQQPLRFLVGYDSLETVLVLPNRSHVSAFKHTDVDLTIDAGLVVGRNREVQLLLLQLPRMCSGPVNRPLLAGCVITRISSACLYRTLLAHHTWNA